jgi:putative flavoprotein involved in K+ transport
MFMRLSPNHQAEDDPARNQARAWIDAFADALSKRDSAAACALFDPDECFWRDLVAFTWNIMTLEGQRRIQEMLEATLAGVQPEQWEIDDSAAAPEERNGILTTWIRFETSTGRGRAIVRLRNGRCWILMTTLEELKGFEEKSRHRRVMGAEHGAKRGRATWLDARERRQAALGVTEQPYCLIVGGGQGGIALQHAALAELGHLARAHSQNERLWNGRSWARSGRSSLAIRSGYLPVAGPGSNFLMMDWNEKVAA